MNQDADLLHRGRMDADVRRFVEQLNESYARLGADAGADLASRRRIAELAREPWRAGGPPMRETRDIPFGRCRMRLYRPTDAPTLPAMVYVHGGGWTLFSIDTHDRLMREYAARAGIAVIGFDYSLSPEHKFPTALEEVHAAVAWIAGDAPALGIDAARLLIGGDSAGANLAVAASLLRRDRGLPPLAGMVLNYGAFDPRPSASYVEFGTPEYPLLEAEMTAFWNNYVEHPAQLEDPLVAPIRAELHDLPPAFLAIAECDILADGNRLFARKLAAAGVPTEAVTYRGATHSFLEAMSIAPLAVEALDDQAEWIRTIVG